LAHLRPRGTSAFGPLALKLLIPAFEFGVQQGASDFVEKRFLLELQTIRDILMLVNPPANRDVNEAAKNIVMMDLAILCALFIFACRSNLAADKHT
jgi:hypothetical protein